MEKQKSQYGRNQRVAAIMIVVTFLTQLLEIPIVKAAPFVLGDISVQAQADLSGKTAAQNHWGVVAILVDENLLTDSTSYSGLTASYGDKLKTTNLKDRINRYAVDVQGAQDFTKSLVVKVQKTDKVEQIAAALEKLYLEGDGTPNEITKLSGVVTIGDVPLPVVNKQGNHFVSMFPYTDFEDKVYIYNAQSGDYEANSDLKFPKAEVWHGVIKPPVSGDEGRQLLATYFDKNHLFHMGVPEFAQFDKKIFFEDLFNELKGMNLAGFGNYLRYLAHWEDFAYLRYNKHLAELFLGELDQQLKDQGLTPEDLKANAPCDAECKILKNDRNGDWDGDQYSNCYEERLGNMIMIPPGSPLLKEYPEGFINKPTDPKDRFSFPLILPLGITPRVIPNPIIPEGIKGHFHCDDDGSVQDFPDPPQDSAAKDALKSLPDIQSKQVIDNFVYRYVQLFDKYLGEINDFVDNTGRYKSSYVDGGGKKRSDLHTMPLIISTKDDYTSHYLRIVNDAIEKRVDSIIENNKLYGKVQMYSGAKLTGELKYNDDSWHNLEDANFVNFANHAFMGILDDLFINGSPIDNMKTIADCMLYRGSNDGSGKNSILVQAISTLDPKKNGDPDAYSSYAGCYAANLTHPERCFPTRAETPLFNINGTREITPGTLSDNATNYRACFDFKEKTRYKTFKDEVSKYLIQLGKAESEVEKAKIGLPSSPYKPAEQIVLYDNDNVKVTFADVLTHFGRGDWKDNDGDGVIDNAAEGDPKYGIPTNDWQQIGERILQRNGSFYFGNSPFSGVKILRFKIEPKIAKNTFSDPVQLDSITYHKEPTNETIKSQLDAGGYTESIPIDNPRFVTFQDKSPEHAFRKIVYPNVFQATSYESFVAQLTAQEAELQKIADASGIAVSVAGQLTSAVSGAADVFTDTQKTAILQANSADIKDALKWRDMNIDEKHVYVLENYLSQLLNPFVEKVVAGYESTYLVSKAVEDPATGKTSSDLLMRFNGNYKPEEVDLDFLKGQRPPETPKTKPAGAKAGAAKSEDELLDGVFITEWLKQMLQWVKDTAALVGSGFGLHAECDNGGAAGGDAQSTEKVTSKPPKVDDVATLVTPGDPAVIGLDADAHTLRSGGLSNTMVHAKLLDAKGNLENQSSNRLTFTIEGPGTLDVSNDEDQETAGVQITSVGGEFNILLTTTADTGMIKVHASYSPAITADLNLASRNDLKLLLQAEKPTITSDFATQDVLNLNVVDGKNNLVSDFGGTAKFILENPALGKFVTSPEQKITHGIGKNIFEVANLAGTEKVTATVTGFDPVTASITITGKSAKKILLESSQKTLESNGSSTAEIVAKLYDTDDNFVANDSSTQVTFKLTDDTKAYATFDGATTVQAKNGEVHITLRSTLQSGPVNVVATGTGLVTASLSLEAVKLFHAQQLKDLSPRTLFAALLGSDYGNVFDENYLGGWFVFSGTTESAVSLLSSPNQHLQLANVDANGKVGIFDESSIDSRVVPGNAANVPTRIILSNTETHEDLAELFTVYKPVPQNKANILEANAALSTTQEGMAVQMSAENSDYSTAKVADGVAILKHGNEVVHIYDSGSIKITDNSFKLELLPTADQKNQKFLTFKVTDSGNDVAQITAVTNLSSDVALLGPDVNFNTAVSLQSGTYFHQLTSKQQYRAVKSFSGNSSANAHAMALVDMNEDLPKSQAPGFSYVSLEGAPNEQGIGFGGDNKFMLLFAAGNSVGESNLPYAAESGIVLGDPTVRLNNRIGDFKTGFTKDIGKEIYFGDENVQELVQMDYNGDGLKDLLVAYKDGKVRLLQNNRANPKFEDKGIFMNFPTGIISMASGDLNHDGLADLIVASKDSCRQGEICINEYENHHGNFVLNYLPLQPFTEKNRVFQIRSADMNGDGFDDLITSDDTGTIRVFYNRQGTLDPNGQFVGGLGLHINNTANLKTEVLIAYDGMPVNDPAKTDDDGFFADVTVNKKTLDLNAGEKAALDAIQQSKAQVTQQENTTQVQMPFVYLDGSPSLANSEKRAEDTTAPLNVLASGDVVKYTLIFKNSAAYDLKNFMVADVFPANMEVQKSSIVCADCGTQTLQIDETGQSLRPYIISGFTVPAGKQRTITYTATVQALPRVKITVGKNLTKSLPANAYLMIGATPEKNTSGRMTFYYANGIDAVSKQIQYQSFTTPPPGAAPPTPVPANPLYKTFPPSNKDFADNNKDGIPDNVQDLQKELTTNDSDGDGLPNLYDDLNGGLDSIIDTAQSIVNALNCGTGCIPMPINFAFLAPGWINVMGVPGGLDPGLPVFAWGIPSLIPTWPPSPYQGSFAGGRIYLSPTLTASVGMGICLGPYLDGECWAFKLPFSPLDLLIKNACDAISKSINEAMANANSFISENGMSAMSQSGVLADSTGRNATGGMSGSTTLGNYQYRADVSTNFRVPGFPQVITKWIEDQTSEIINKLSDLPDFYFIYPDTDSIAGLIDPKENTQQPDTSKQKKSTIRSVLAGPEKVLSFLNSMPLIQIQSKEVALKIPALTANEIAKIMSDGEQWVEDERNEVNRTLQVWTCGSQQLNEKWEVVKAKDYKDSPYQTMCDKLIVDTSKLRQGVEKNLKQLQIYLELPRKLLQWKNVTAKYLYQIICYLDAIMQFTGGYIKKQTTRILAWFKMIKKIKQLLETWKLLIDVMVDYQASCDKCTSSRFTLMELLLKLFALIPSPPIIPFPKLPDFYLDVSQIQTGLKILWPEIKFIPERVIFPRIPRIYLPDVPSLTIHLPTIPVLPPLPELPDLPDLPPLPIPKLPDIPPPPKIPELPAQIKATIDILKKLIKILCLIRKGLIPLPELDLKSHIEQLTERPLSPLLPIDLLLKLQLPAIQYQYVDHIEIKTILNFQLDFDPILKVVEKVAASWNSIGTDLVQALNRALRDAAAAADAAANSATNAMQQAVPSGNIDVNVGGKQSSARGLLADALSALEKKDPLLGSMLVKYEAANRELQKVAAEYTKNNAQMGGDIHLVATQRYLSKNDPLLNQSLDKIKARIQMEDAPQYESQKKVAQLRNAMIAYHDNSGNLMKKLGSSPDLKSAVEVLAQAPSLQAYLPVEKVANANDGGHFYASAGATDAGVAGKSPVTVTASLKTDAFTSFVDTVKSDVQKNAHLFASAGGLPDVPPGSSGAGGAAEPKGLYILNPDLGVNEKLIQYSGEADSPSQILFMDVNNDGENEIVYSYGSNIYLKENYNKPLLKTYYGGVPVTKALLDLTPAAPAVNGFASDYANNKTVDMSWKAPTEGDVSGYLINYKLAPDAFVQNVSPVTHKIAVIPEAVAKPEDATGTDATNTAVPSLAPLSAQDVSGDLYFDGSERTVVLPGGSGFDVKAGQTIHALMATNFSITTQEAAQHDLPLNGIFTVPEDAEGPVKLVVASGAVEVINPEKTVKHQKVVNGLLLNFDEQIMSEGGSARIAVNDGSYVRVDAGEDVLLKKLESPDQPTLSLTLPNGLYYGKIQAFNHLGSLSTASNIQLMAPSVCADKAVPLVNGGPSERTAYIFKALTIDASKSFDTNGKISSYFLDTDVNVDADKDGDATNDKDLCNNNCTDPLFTLGPYNDLRDRKVMLNVLDEALNRSQQEITIHVVVPAVQLSEDTATVGFAKGHLDVAENNIPIGLIRDRDGVITSLKTKSANKQGKYLTDTKGEFKVDDFNLKDTIVIKNAKGEIVAEIDPKTGRILIKDPNYEVEVLAAELPLLPTRMVVKQKKDGEIIAALFLVPDVNVDTTIDKTDSAYDKNSTPQFTGIHDKDVNGFDDFEFKKVPTNDPSFPGATEIVNNKTQARAAILDTGGNFYSYDNGLSLQLKQANDLTDPLVMQIVYTKDASTPAMVIGEFFIAVHGKNGVQILGEEKFKAFTQKGLPLPKQKKIEEIIPVPKSPGPDVPFKDVSTSSQFYESIKSLFQRHVLDDLLRASADKSAFGADIPIRRSEFADIMLKIFCITPRPEALLAPPAFSDIPFVSVAGGSLPWYYAITKEAYFQGFITGYKAEIDQSTGKTPFKPDAQITRAEAVKIILEALDRKGTIAMGNVPVVSPYYAPYMQIAADLSPYLKQKSLVSKPYIITAGEALKPNEYLTRGEFIAMADRVLKAYDCYTGGSAFINSVSPNTGPSSGGTAVTISGANFAPNPTVTFRGLAATAVKVVNSTTMQVVTPAVLDPGLADVVVTNPQAPSTIFKDGFTYKGRSPKVMSIVANSGPTSGGTVVTIKGDYFMDGITVSFKAASDAAPAPATRVVVLDSHTIVAVTPPHLKPGPVDVIVTNSGFPPTNFSNGFTYVPANVDPRQKIGEGVYVIQPECNVCPCPSTIDHTADLIVGDKVFAVISGDDNTQIFSKSNVVEITKIPEQNPVTAP